MGGTAVLVRLLQLAVYVVTAVLALSPNTSRASETLHGDCRDQCGDVAIPYPFGIGAGCYFDERFNITCDDSTDPPSAYLRKSNIKITNISLSEGELEVQQYIAKDCYDESGNRSRDDSFDASLSLSYNFTISAKKNKFTAIGCDTYAIIKGYSRSGKSYTTGCMSLCNRLDDIDFESCSGVGCCQIASIPSSLINISVSLDSYYSYRNVSGFSDRCSYAILAQESQFRFSNASFDEFKDKQEFPLVLDWTIGDLRCHKAIESEGFACKSDSECLDSKTGAGYLCQCKKGFEGNPYHPQGCRDIDECKGQNPCVNGICGNTNGRFDCTCQEGYIRVNDTFCSKEKSGAPNTALLVYVPLSVSIGVLALVFLSLMLFWGHKKRKLIRQKEKFFEQNGGLMLQRRLSSEHQKGSFETAKIFTEEELMSATKNYQQVVGEGGYGTVYKGILPDNKVVAIKKPKIGTQMHTEQQIEQFINEVMLLMQINHRNVVRLLGCCLDTEVPILVYEFITNGTLYERIHKKGSEQLSLSWELRLKIATEIAGALAYLHYEINTPILHRDIKTMNVLLDENYTAKVSDFGTSRLVPLDQDELSTLVQGTIGYLDPEYLQSSQLTEKSDVYSFGVVLAELLTGKKALSFDKSEGTASNLSMSFLSLKDDNQWRAVIDEDIADDTNMEAIKEVANLTKRCLRIKGDERPTMKEVAMELGGLRAMSKHPWEKVDPFHVEESEYLLGSSSVDPSYDLERSSGSTTAVYDSMQSQLILKPYKDGR